MMNNTIFHKLTNIFDNQIKPKYLLSESISKVDNIEEWILVSSTIPIWTILISYLAFVLKIGPQFMRKRSPFNLKYVLVAYNVLQVICSVFLFYITTDFLLQYGLIIQQQCMTDNKEFKIKTATIIHFYLLAKVSELLDTIFFVLRKRDRQVSFLHVYHHTFTVLFSWYAVKFEPSYVLIFVGSINSFVHIVMYAYYGLSAFPHLSKYLWWKKYITKMQLVQFFLIIVQLTLSRMLSSCSTPNVLVNALVSNAFLFIFLFSKFYIKEYLNMNRRHSENTAKERDITNINNMNDLSNNKINNYEVSNNCDDKLLDKND